MNGKEKNYICLLLERKSSLIEGYLSVSEKMRESLAPGKDAEIDAFISKRREFINKIRIIDRSLNDFSGVPDDFKNVFNGYSGHIKILLGKIAGIDADVTGIVKEKCRAIKAELLEMNKAGQAAKGYGKNGKYVPVYLDDRK